MIQVNGNCTIVFDHDDVKSIDYKDEVSFVWITLVDGMQINIPINIVHALYSKLQEEK